MLVDSHCHLDFDDFDGDIADIICRAKENGVNMILNAGNNLDELPNQLALSEQYPFVYAAVGVHPHNAAEYPELKAEDIIPHTKHKKVIGIGETGLDYYYDYAPKDLQIKLLQEHIKAAQETGLPIIIHNRDSDDDMAAVLGEAYKQKPFAGMIHCFNSSAKFAEFALSIGFYLSASGMITFNKCGELRDIFAELPLNRLLIETDSPFLAPIPERGHRNEPSFVRYVAEKLAQIRDMSFDDIAQLTSDNFCTLFRKASDKGRRKYK